MNDHSLVQCPDSLAQVATFSNCYFGGVSMLEAEIEKKRRGTYIASWCYGGFRGRV
jgi:hypothetical protein